MYQITGPPRAEANTQAAGLAAILVRRGGCAKPYNAWLSWLRTAPRSCPGRDRDYQAFPVGGGVTIR
jgi:hypothetical protein